MKSEPAGAALTADPRRGPGREGASWTATAPFPYTLSPLRLHTPRIRLLHLHTHALSPLPFLERTTPQVKLPSDKCPPSSDGGSGQQASDRLHGGWTLGCRGAEGSGRAVWAPQPLLRGPLGELFVTVARCEGTV